VLRGVQPWGGRCVQDNWDQLSAQCGLRARVVPEHVPPACHHDALMLCKHLTPGNNRIHECLWKFDGVRNEDGHKLSDHCLSSLILSSHGLCPASQTSLASVCQRTQCICSQGACAATAPRVVRWRSV
jgi:hypothetical protein